MTAKRERRVYVGAMIAAALGIAGVIFFLVNLTMGAHPDLGRQDRVVVAEPTEQVTLSAPVQGPGVQEYLTSLREGQGSELDGVTDTELVGFADRFCAAEHNENGTERAVTALVTQLPTHGLPSAMATPIAQTASAQMCPQYLTEVQDYLESQGLH